MVGRKLNFRIVESSNNDSYEEVFDEFKKDYLNPLTHKKDLEKKYELPNSVYNDFVKRILKSEGIVKMPTRRALDNPMRYIYKLSKRWGIRKELNGEIRYFGYYDDLDVCMLVRDKLYYSDWDNDIADELIRKYSVGKYVPVINQVEEKYDEFKDMYLNKPIRYGDILKKLHISSTVYKALLDKLREEIPDAKKCKLPSRVKDRPNRYIVSTDKGYVINKSIDGKLRHFGTFKKLQDAVDRRNWLETHDWSR